MHRLAVTIGSIGVLALAACGGTGGNVDKEACTYLDGGPYTEVTAGNAMDATAPPITADARAYRVTLPAAGVGYLSFDSLDDTEYAAFLDRTVPFAAFTPTGTMMPLSASATSAGACTTIHGRHIVELPISQFFIALGPDAGGAGGPVEFVLLPYNPD